MKRLPIIRHIRWLMLKLRVERTVYALRLAGHANADRLANNVLDSIWHGKC